jgi:secreted trypsin-like serine protease
MWSSLSTIIAADQPATKVRTGSRPLRRVLEAFDRGEGPGRIIQGKPTTIEEQPWQAALVAAEIPTNPEAQFCGASIIGQRWLITAAHCVDEGTVPSQVAILVGTASLTKAGRRVSLEPDGIIIHADWNADTNENDVALLKVAADLGGTAIRGFGTKDVLKDGQDVTITGWGALAFNARTGSNDLMAVTVPAVSNVRCNKPASYDGKVKSTMFCAGRAAGGPDSCQGDSGGPATTGTASGRKLAGIVSWGDGCGFPNKYGVYTRVSAFASWVAQKTAGAVKW